MDTIAVAVSGTVGKQVLMVPSALTSASSSARIAGGRRLLGWILAPVSAKARVEIREGISTGPIKFAQCLTSGGSDHVKLPKDGMRFDRGMHVKVLGAGAVCYLMLD